MSDPVTFNEREIEDCNRIRDSLIKMLDNYEYQPMKPQILHFDLWLSEGQLIKKLLDFITANPVLVDSMKLNELYEKSIREFTTKHSQHTANTLYYESLNHFMVDNLSGNKYHNWHKLANYPCIFGDCK